MARSPSAMVTDCGYTSGLTVVRSLGRSGWRVVGTHSAPVPHWARSKYLDRFDAVPSAEQDPDGWLETTLWRARSERVDIIFPTTEKSIHILDANRGAVAPVAGLVLPDHDPLALARDKHRSQQLAESLGIPCPRSVQVESAAEAKAVAEQLGWPVVVKPLRSHDVAAGGDITTRAVGYAWSADELEAALLLPRAGGFPLVLQELVSGTGAGIELLCDRGRVVRSFQHRRLHEVPLTGGMSASRRAELPDPVMLDYSTRLMNHLQWTGLAMVEFKLGPSGPVFLEINGRVWGSIALPVRAGLDFPLLAAEQHVGPVAGSVQNRQHAAPGSDATVRTGLVCRNLELELRWLAMATRQRLARYRSGDGDGGVGQPAIGYRADWTEIAKTVVALLNPRTELDVQQLDDWRPGVHDLMKSIGSVAGDSLSSAGSFAGFSAGRKR